MILMMKRRMFDVAHCHLHLRQVKKKKANRLYGHTELQSEIELLTDQEVLTWLEQCSYNKDCV